MVIGNCNMKYFVVYDSFFGNTKAVAEEVAKTVGGKAMLVSDFSASSLSAGNILVLGSPIRGWRPSENTQAFLSSLKPGDLSGIKVTTFDTRVKLFIHGDAKEKMAKALQAAEAELLLAPEAFYVKDSEGPLFEDELKKAELWGRKIKEKGDT